MKYFLQKNITTLLIAVGCIVSLKSYAVCKQLWAGECFTCGVSSSQAYTRMADEGVNIVLADGKAEAGEEITLSVSMTGCASAFQFDVYTPEGISIKKIQRGSLLKAMDENDEYIFTLQSSSMDGGFHRVVAYNTTDTPTAEAGEVVNLTFEVDASLTAGVYDILLKELECGQSGVVLNTYKETSAKLTVSKKTEPLEVVNIVLADGEVEAGEEITLPVSLTGCASAFQFDVYTPEGISLKKVQRGSLLKAMDENDEYIFTLQSSSMDGGFHRVVAYNTTDTPTAEAGEVVNLTFEVDASLTAGVYDILLKELECGQSGVVLNTYKETSAKLTVSQEVDTDNVSVEVMVDNIKYKIENGEATLVDGTSASGNVVIPSYVIYNGKQYPVTIIGIFAFESCYSLTSITIPNSVTSIVEYAFSDCITLASITIPNSVTCIGDGAFSFCMVMTSITIPNSVTFIGEYAFAFCFNLVSITIPESVTLIGEGAFCWCEDLSKVVCYWTDLSKLTVNDDIFESISADAKLTVPKGTKAMYQATEPWSNFKYIEEAGVGEETHDVANLVLADGEVEAGGEVVLPIMATGCVTKFQFNIRFPKGIYYSKLVNDSPLTEDFRLMTASTINCDSLFVKSVSSTKTPTAEAGEVLKLVIRVDENLVEGEYEIRMKGIECSVDEVVLNTHKETTAKLTVLKRTNIIGNIDTEDTEPIAIYTVDGVKVSKTEKGKVYVFHYANGNVVKRMMK